MNALRSVKSACRAIRKNIRDWFMEGYGIPFDPQWDDLNTNSRSIYGKSSYETEPRAEQIHNIYHITFLLRQKLIRDVVPAILEYADLYGSTTSAKNFYPNLEVYQENAPKLVIECEIANVKTRILRPVRKITFKILSCDQRAAQNRSEDSWTWFTARKSSPEMALLPGCMLDVNERNEIEYRKHREICSNDMADWPWPFGKWHTITWRADSLDPVQAEWVSSLVAGDRFAVYAWANYPDWVNHVTEISVTVHYVALV